MLSLQVVDQTCFILFQTSLEEQTLNKMWTLMILNLRSKDVARGMQKVAVVSSSLS